MQVDFLANSIEQIAQKLSTKLSWIGFAIYRNRSWIADNMDMYKLRVHLLMKSTPVVERICYEFVTKLNIDIDCLCSLQHKHDKH